MNIFLHLETWHDDEHFRPAPCPEPTDARPGSPKKFAVLMARIEAGVELWHDGDRFSSDDNPQIGRLLTSLGRLCDNATDTDL